MMTLSEIITYLGVSLILYYSLSKILNFYGIGQDVYGIYVLFYFLIMICILILPSNYPEV
jgi:hypothetical protein